jgi:hypothetical protein
MKPRKATTQFSYSCSFMRLSVVPYHDHVPSQVTKKMSDKFAHTLAVNILRVKIEIKSQALLLRTHRNSGDDRNFVSSVPMAVGGRLSFRRPGPFYVRDQKESRLVDEDDMGAQPLGFFLIRGHCLSFHRWISRSLRSSARRSGFCGLHPIFAITRQIWSGWYRTPNSFLIIVPCIYNVIATTKKGEG